MWNVLSDAMSAACSYIVELYLTGSDIDAEKGTNRPKLESMEVCIKTSVCCCAFF